GPSSLAGRGRADGILNHAAHGSRTPARPGAGRATARGGSGRIGTGTERVAGPDPIGLGRPSASRGDLSTRCVPVGTPARNEAARMPEFDAQMRRYHIVACGVGWKNPSHETRPARYRHRGEFRPMITEAHRS